MKKHRTVGGRNRRQGFFPQGSLKGKSNYKRYYRIERDGSIMESVFLNVPDPRLREEIISIHFLRTYVKWVIQDDVGFKILGRDDPWDFKIKASNGDQFNIEIVSIAENEQLHKNNKREEAIDIVSKLETIPLSRLRKLNRDFPDKEIEAFIKQWDAAGVSKDFNVKNPWYGDKERILLSYMPPTDESLFELLQTAILAKSGKLHAEKNKVFLIIDNRTSTFGCDEFLKALAQFNEASIEIPFREVWFYTGYYSDDDGNNAEWSLAPIDVPDSTRDKMQDSIELNKLAPDANNMIYDHNI